MASPLGFDLGPFVRALLLRSDGVSSSPSEGVRTVVGFFRMINGLSRESQQQFIDNGETPEARWKRALACRMAWNFVAIDDSWSTYDIPCGSNGKDLGVNAIVSAFHDGSRGITNATTIVGEPRVGKTVSMFLSCIYAVLCGAVPVLVCGVSTKEQAAEVHRQIQWLFDVLFDVCNTGNVLQVIAVVGRREASRMRERMDRYGYKCVLVFRYEASQMKILEEVLASSSFKYWMVIDESDLVHDDDISDATSIRHATLHGIIQVRSITSNVRLMLWFHWYRRSTGVMVRLMF